MTARPWTRAEVEALVRALEPDARRVVLFVLGTGLRKAEVEALEWDAVDLEAGVLRVAGRGVPLGSDVVDLLADLPRSGEHVFPRAAEVGPALRQAAERAGVGGPATLHRARATFAVWRLAGGAGLDRVAEELDRLPRESEGEA